VSERFAKRWDVGHMLIEYSQRTEPGPGADKDDDGVPGTTKVKLRSTPHVPTARLLRRRDHLVWLCRTAEGLRSWDESRRSLIEQGCHLVVIEHELALRGV
jgi:hypothetical protein